MTTSTARLIGALVAAGAVRQPRRRSSDAAQNFYKSGPARYIRYSCYISVMTSPVAAATEATQAAAGARFFRVLGDPIRLRILELLLDGPHTVSELVAALGVPQARVSNHLACLRWCQFVESERQGRTVIYCIDDPRLGELLSAARRLIDDKVEHLASCRRIGPDWV